MSKNELILTIDEPANGDDRLDVSVFVAKTRCFVDLLKHSAPSEDKKEVSFKLVRISHASPVTMAVEVESADAVIAQKTFNCVRENLDWASNGKIYHLSDAVFSDLERLSKDDPKKVGKAEIRVVNGTDEEHVYQLDSRFRKMLSRERNTEKKCISTIDGKLEQINIHGQNSFRIYPSLMNWNYVDCKFSQKQLGEVQNALGRYVSVRGECCYKRNANFPHLITVHDMEVLPNSEKLPTLGDLQGIAPHMTGELSSVEFVRQQRDEWDK